MKYCLITTNNLQDLFEIKMKKILVFCVVVFVVACQSTPESAQKNIDKTQVENEVAPCTNGFDDVNVCQLKS